MNPGSIGSENSKDTGDVQIVMTAQELAGKGVSLDYVACLNVPREWLAHGWLAPWLIRQFRQLHCGF